MTVHGGKEARLSSFVMTTQWRRDVRRREIRLLATTMAALGLQAASVSTIKRKMTMQNLNILWCAPTRYDVPIIDVSTTANPIQDFSMKIATLPFQRDASRHSLASRTAGGSHSQIYLKRITAALWWTSSWPAKLCMLLMTAATPRAPIRNGNSIRIKPFLSYKSHLCASKMERGTRVRVEQVTVLTNFIWNLAT